MKADLNRPSAAPARDRPEVLSPREMVEREAERAFPWFSDMSLSVIHAGMSDTGPYYPSRLTSIHQNQSSSGGGGGTEHSSARISILSPTVLRPVPNGCKCMYNSSQNNVFDKQDLCCSSQKSLHFEIAGKYVKAGPPPGKILLLIKKTSRKSPGIMMV